MIGCQRAAELISLSIDHRLSWRQRLALTLHLWTCWMCRRFQRQARLMQRLTPEAIFSPPLPLPTLSQDARERIKLRLQQWAREREPEA